MLLRDFFFLSQSLHCCVLIRKPWKLNSENIPYISSWICQRSNMLKTGQIFGCLAILKANAESKHGFPHVHAQAPSMCCVNQNRLCSTGARYRLLLMLNWLIWVVRFVNIRRLLSDSRRGPNRYINMLNCCIYLIFVIDNAFLLK